MKITIRPWPKGQGFEADIQVQCIDGTKIRKRVKSPVPSRSGSQRWAEALARELMAKGKPAPVKETPTLAAFVGEFMTYQATANKPSELRSKRSILDHHLLPAFGSMRLDAIDTRAIDKFKVEQLGRERKVGGMLKPATINNHLTVLVRILNVAKRWGLVERVPEVERLRVGEQPFDFLTFDETSQFLRATLEHYPSWYPYMLTSFRTGLRVGEMLALDWAHVDLDGRLIRVEFGYTREGGIASPKSGKSRDVPLTLDAAEALRQHREVGVGPLVFPGGGGGVGSVKAVDWHFGRIALLAGLRHVHAHDARHTFTSHCIMRGIPAVQVSRWLGHAGLRMTLRYAHLAPDFGHEQVDKLDPPTGLRVVGGVGEIVETATTRMRKTP